MVFNPNVLIPIPATPSGSQGFFNGATSIYSPAVAHPSPFPWQTTEPLKRIDSGYGREPRTPGGSRTPSGFEFLDWGSREDGTQRGRNFDWEVYPSENPFEMRKLYKRRLGPTEVSYYLGSRGDGGALSGVNDMYLNIGFKAPPALVNQARLVSIWTELIQRHALLAATVQFDSLEEMRFCYDPLGSNAAREQRAASLLDLRCDVAGDRVIDTYLNGPRLLSDQKLSSLILSTPASSFDSLDDGETEQQYHMTLVTTHFLGDGMALHLTAHEFFLLLAATPTISSSSDPVITLAVDSSIDSVLAQRRIDTKVEEPTVEVGVDQMALAMESKLSTTEEWGRMAWAGARVEFDHDQAKLVGGHTFPRAALGNRRTLVPTICYSTQVTSQILKTCKSHGVTIAHAVFALSNLAYIRAVPALEHDDKEGTKGKRDERLPLMLYSAMNLRPWLLDGGKPESDWFHIAIGYYNIILPSFLPSTRTDSQAFWHRALITRQQTSKVVKSQWLSSRSKLMALERERRSIGFEREDDRRRAEKQRLREIEAGMTGLGFGDVAGMEQDKVSVIQVKMDAPIEVIVESAQIQTTSFEVPKAKPAPSLALMGVSMLGNLDAIYKHSTYHSITLNSLNTGSRQRPGALLLFAYTFVGQLWFSLGYDVNGFEKGAVEEWWVKVQEGVQEFLVV